MSLHTSVIKLFLAPTALHHGRLPQARDNNLLYIWWRHTFSSTFICYGVTIKIQQLTYSVTPHWEGLLVWSWTSEVANEFKRDEAGAGKLANESWRAVLNRDATYFNSKKDISEMFFFLIFFSKKTTLFLMQNTRSVFQKLYKLTIKTSEFIYYQMQCHGNSVCLSVSWKVSLLFTVINHPNKKQIAAAGVAQICKEEDLRSHGTIKVKYYTVAVC